MAVLKFSLLLFFPHSFPFHSIFQFKLVYHIQLPRMYSLHSCLLSQQHTDSLQRTYSNQIGNNRKTASTSYLLFLTTMGQNFILIFHTKTCSSVNSCSWNTHLSSVYMEIKRPTRCNRSVSLLQNLLFAQHVLGTIMPWCPKHVERTISFAIKNPICCI